NTVELNEGGQWWLTKPEEEQLEAWNDRHKVVSAVADMVMGWIDLDRLGHKSNMQLTASEMLKIVGLDKPTNNQCRECGSVLREKLGAPRRINGREKWRVPLIDLDAEAIKLLNSKIIEEDEY
uniref:hypothetical protein n=1 Tax=Sphingobium abikonense TaxID=86193 RepID=UPI000AF2E2D5